MNASEGYKHPAIAGSGTIACGLAATATATGKTLLLARSDASAWRAEEQATAACAKIDGADSERLRVTTEPADLAECDIVVEAVVEDAKVKGELLAVLGDAAPDADLATTTSSLSVGAIGKASGHGDRFFGLHVFNPVPRMKLVELCFPDSVNDGTASGRWPGAGQSARPRSRCPTRRGSSSTACSSPTSSTPCGCSSAPA